MSEKKKVRGDNVNIPGVARSFKAVSDVDGGSHVLIDACCRMAHVVARVRLVPSIERVIKRGTQKSSHRTELKARKFVCR